MYFWTRNYHGEKVNLRQKSFAEFDNCIVRALEGAIRNSSASVPGKVVAFGSI